LSANDEAAVFERSEGTVDDDNDDSEGTISECRISIFRSIDHGTREAQRYRHAMVAAALTTVVGCDRVEREAMEKSKLNAL
jgi:hypothetical protein